MARKRKDLGEVTGTQIAVLMQRGGTADSIAAATGQSRATIGRRMKELREKGMSAPSPVELPSEEIPEGAPPEVLEELLANARQGLQTAQAAGNLAAVGTMGRLITSIMVEQRKAAPVPVADPNDRPDLKSLAAQVAVRMHALIDEVVGK